MSRGTSTDWDRYRRQTRVRERRRTDPEYGKTGPAPYIAWKDFGPCPRCGQQIKKGSEVMSWLPGRAAHCVCPEPGAEWESW